MTLQDAFETLMCWKVKPEVVLRRPKKSLSAMGVTLLASSMPLEVKYQSSMYSMALTLSRANWAGKKGSLLGMEAFSSKSEKVSFFLVRGRGALSGRKGGRGGGEGEGSGAGGSGDIDMVPYGLKFGDGLILCAGEAIHDGLPHRLELWVIP